ncbi:MAG: integrase [Kiritimatiellae bacterium]|nr:integrase [Kiritimatiellia bacterium]
MKMSENATREYVVRMRVRYGAMKTKKAKGRILDDFCATTELSRKHAIKVLGDEAPPLKRSGRKATYGAKSAQALKEIWLAAGQPCSKLMKPIMDCYVSSYEKREGAFDPAIRSDLLAMSASSMDRLLAPARIVHPRRPRSPQGVAAVKEEVPIRAGDWDVSEPGWIEVDTVAHCGGNMAGNFVWSLTMTDIQTQWTEIRMMWNRGAAGTFSRIEEIKHALPFGFRGLDCDNGGEFLNWHLYTYCQNAHPRIELTRSRPYMKNDQAHVEQKNGTHVRGLLGHDRLEDPESVEGINEVGVLWSLWKNLYSPVRKLESKTRVGHRYQKRYDKARTPAQRVLECASVDATQKDRIRHLLATTDCFELKHLLDEKLKDVFDQIRKRKEAALRGLSPLALRAAPSGPVLKPRRAAGKARQVVKDTNRMVS